ncbi:MAG: maleylpyruvate isomerase family mycothiol-dependent enzyme [Sporichthyaceae bacterium]|nr:maleylpyruvate isomerase family mycothiol-dependent enzyme [Sporichthyaceae bacterium]
MPPSTRRPDPERVTAALSGQWQALRRYVAELDQDRLSRPSGLPGWTAGELVAHIADGINAVTERLSHPPPARVQVSIAEWARRCAPRADRLADEARELAAAESPVDQLNRAIGRAEAALDQVVNPQRLLWSPHGGFRLPDYLITRVIEAVVHADDLDRDFPQERAALGICVRALADILAATVPGHSVELRVPPFAAVQCIPGPRHTRGTPPGVVELDPPTWLRLATGRLGWSEAEAAGRLRASGERTDLSPYLPVLA